MANIKKKKSNILNYLILGAITFLVLYFSLKDNFDEIIHELLSVNIFFIVIAIILSFAFYYFKAISLYKLTTRYKKDYTFKKSLKIVLSTQFFNGITPFASGGQPFQIYMLKKDNVKLVDSTNIAIQNFILYQIALVTLGTVAIISNFFFNFLAESHILKELVTVGFIINACVIVGLFLISFNKKFNSIIINFAIKIMSHFKIIKNQDEKIKKWDDNLLKFNKGAKMLIKSKMFFAKAVTINILGLICQYLVPLAIIYSMGDYTSVDAGLVICTSAYVMLIGSFVPIPGGTGGLEFGYISFFGNFIQGSILQASMLLWRLINYYLAIVIGAITLNLKEKD